MDNTRFINQSIEEAKETLLISFVLVVNNIPKLHNSSNTYGPNINWTIFMDLLCLLIMISLKP
ncbi:MAG: hypothetical protein ACRYFB_05965 [Janthinobacterium lividum]